MKDEIRLINLEVTHQQTLQFSDHVIFNITFTYSNGKNFMVGIDKGLTASQIAPKLFGIAEMFEKDEDLNPA